MGIDMPENLFHFTKEEYEFDKDSVTKILEKKKEKETN